MIKIVGIWLLGHWVYVVGALIGGFLYWKVSTGIENYIAEQKKEEDRIVELTSARDRAVIESLSLQATIWEMKANERRAEINARKTKEEQTQVREQEATEKGVFEGHDLGEMARRHEKWIEKLSNKATQEQFDEIEAIVNN